MSRKASNTTSGSGFLRKLTWTVLFGVIFGAGLITGQRILRNGSSPPLVAVESKSDESEKSDRDDDGERSEANDENPELSFYERLSSGVDSAADRMKGSGTAAEPRNTSESSGPTDGDETAKYTLQISAYPERERARSRLRRLEKMGLDPYLVTAELPDKGTYYRIRIGKFESMEAAKTFERELERKRGVESAVTPL